MRRQAQGFFHPVQHDMDDTQVRHAPDVGLVFGVGNGVSVADTALGGNHHVLAQINDTFLAKGNLGCLVRRGAFLCYGINLRHKAGSIP